MPVVRIIETPAQATPLRVHPPQCVFLVPPKSVHRQTTARHRVVVVRLFSNEENMPTKPNLKNLGLHKSLANRPFAVRPKVEKYHPMAWRLLLIIRGRLTNSRGSQLKSRAQHTSAIHNSAPTGQHTSMLACHLWSNTC